MNDVFAQRMEPFVCAAGAGCTAALAIHPIDLIKVHKQLAGQSNPLARPSFIGIGTEVVKREGFRGLYSGLSAAFGRQLVYGTSRMGLHRTVSDYIKQQRESQGLDGKLPFLQKFLVSAVTGGIGATLGCPADVALVRMQADTTAVGAEKRNYKGILDALRRMVAEEGVATLWRGTFPLIARGIAMNVGQMASYDMAKEIITDSWGGGMTTNLASAGVSGFFAAFLSLPFDMIKSRLMNMKPEAGGVMPYKGVIDCGWKVIRHEGAHRLWAGFSTYYARCAPTAMIQLIAIEQFLILYRKNLRHHS